MWAAVMLAAASWLDIPPVTQSTPSNCGPACLTAVLRYYGVWCYESEMARDARTNAEGTNPADLIRVARERGMRPAVAVGRTLRWLRIQLRNGKPVIVLIRTSNGSHYIVVKGFDQDDVTYMDPDTGRDIRRSHADFLLLWSDCGDDAWPCWGCALSRPEKK